MGARRSWTEQLLIRCRSSPSGLQIPYSSLRATAMKSISPVAAALREARIARRAPQQAWRHSCVGRNHGRAITMTAKLGDHHVGTGDNRLMRSSIRSDSPRGIATSAICKTNPPPRRSCQRRWKSAAAVPAVAKRCTPYARPAAGHQVRCWAVRRSQSGTTSAGANYTVAELQAQTQERKPSRRCRSTLA